MPVFEYRCLECGERFDRVVLPGEEEPEACPSCGGAIRRAFGRVAAVFQGWGFARTDSLLPEDRPRKPFKLLKEKAEQIADET